MKVDTREGLQLHVSRDGCVWFGDGVKPERLENMTADSIAELDWVREADRVCLLGTRDNADLIAALARPRFELGLNRPKRLELASPGLIAPKDRDDPPVVLSQMRRISWASSLGGWHDVNNGDYVTYQLVQEWKNRTDDSVPPRVMALLSKHPAWPAFAFIPDVSIFHAWQLITLIVDPRWYMDPLAPDRKSRIYGYLGIFEHNAELACNPSAPVKPAFGRDRFETILKVWTDRIQPDPEVLKSGKHFLWNCWASHSSQPRGLLRACRMLVDFICGVWLQSITYDGRTLFVPEYFFHREEYVKEYKTHRAGFPVYYK